jgi:hypothetical protein
MSGLPWFRQYHDFLTDPKMLGLSFEDQRHFIAVCALKARGDLDQACDSKILDRMVAQSLWIDHAMISDVKTRLIDAGLINGQWQPLAWEKRQQSSDSSASRTAKWREKKKALIQASHETSLETSHETSHVTKGDGLEVEVEVELEVEKIEATREYQFAIKIFDTIKAKYTHTKTPNFEEWAKELDRAVRLDGRTLEDLWKVFRWAHRSDFWCSNILSAKTLRNSYDRMASQMQDDQEPSKKNLNGKTDNEILKLCKDSGIQTVGKTRHELIKKLETAR